MKDKSNFYNLPQEEQKKESRNLWKDSFPNVPEFSEDLKHAIMQEECPKVITLEGEYGMGKTYFSSRFCEYLRTGENPVSAIYFSAWEDDNLPDPLLTFSKEIMRNLQTTKENVDEIMKIFIKVMSSFDISFGMPGISATFKFKDLKKELLKQENPLRDFKSELTEVINKLKGKRLVLIVDELDRCRPDYAIKVLETIKHFFDIDKVVVMLPVNYAILTSSVESVYSLKTDKAEAYLRKFINYRVRIPTPDYKQFIESNVNETVFKEEIAKGYLNVENIPFCSLKTLQEDLIKYSELIKPSLRELTNILNVVELAIRAKKERIRCSLLVHLLFKKFIQDNKKDISADRLPVNDNLKLALGKQLESLIAQYGNYVNGSVNTYRQNFGNVRHKVTQSQCEQFIENFKKIKTYGEIATLLRDRNDILDVVYGGSWSRHDAFVDLCKKIHHMIDLGINEVGIFEIGDELNTRPKVEEYKRFVNHLKI